MMTLSDFCLYLIYCRLSIILSLKKMSGVHNKKPNYFNLLPMFIEN